MKKLLLLLITLTTFTNVSYASFPVTENTQTEVVATIEKIQSPESVLYMMLGFFVGFFSWFLVLIPLLLLFVPNKSFRLGILAGFLTGALFLLFFLGFFAG